MTVKTEIEIPFNFVEITFYGQLVDSEEKGEFYYKITAHASDKPGAPWEHALIANVKRSLHNKQVAKEILKDIKSKMQQNIKNKRGK